MLVREAAWIGSALLRSGLTSGDRLLNVGSSTQAFRTAEQPWVDAEVFAPLRARGVEVVHLDLKPDDGVDLIGDLSDPAFRDGLGSDWDAVLCSNLLEHLEDRQPLMAALPRVLRPGGALVVTVPCRFPRHADPIDSMYRPQPGELVADLVQGVGNVSVDVAEAVEVLDSRHWTYWARYTHLRGRRPLVGLAGLSLRALRNGERRAELRTLPSRTSATCVLARRS